ncbi:MAG TPA: hypothetical protein VE871_00915, partial [Longimicrobium sp.]|nr:hypothetical protein [Longimicrobium sp.]
MHLRTTLAAALLLMGAAAACDRGSGTDPEPALAVQLTVAATSRMDRAADESPIVSCEIALNATATGDEGMVGRWSEGMLRYMVGADTVPVDSLQLTGADLEQIFGPSALAPGYSESNTLRLTASVPFSVRVELAYRATGSRQDEWVRGTAACGPRPGQGAAPALSNFSVAGPAGELQPGDTLTITWTAHSPVGLWETGFQVSGAFQHMVRSARLATTDPSTSTVKLVIPPTAVLGRPVLVRPFAMDAALQSSVGTVHTTVPLVDRRPPAAYTVALERQDFGVRLEGQYPTVDSIALFVGAEDNHQIEYVVFEAGPAGTHRDSVRYATRTLDGFKIAVPAALAGQRGLRVQVRDVAGNASPWYGSATTRFYRTRTVPVHRVALPNQAEEVVMDHVRGKLYAAVVNHSGIRVFSLPGLVEGGVIPMPLSPSAMDLTPSGDTLVAVANGHNRLAVADVVRGGETRVHVLEGVGAVYGVAVTPGGKAVSTALLPGGGRALLEIDLATGAWRIVPGSGAIPGVDHGVARSLDRRRMVAGGGCPYDAVAGTLGTCRPLEGTMPMAGDATGTRWGRQGVVFSADVGRV